MGILNSRKLFRYLANTHPRIWILFAFLIVYIAFFIYPIFFSSRTMQFPAYIPVMQTIGGDLSQILGYSSSWAILNGTPYIGENPYPPFVAVFFSPFLFMPFSLAYKLIVSFSLLSFIFGVFFIAAQPRENNSLTYVIFFILFTSFFSYGLHFELERGQFNIISMFFCFFAIWIYYFHNRFRYLAYCLFTISVQLKLFPLIFVVMFISDWRDWKANIKKITMLFSINFIAFFVLGGKIFLDFVNAVRKFMLNGSFGTGLSIRSFVHMILDISTERGIVWVHKYSPIIQLFFLILVLSCILIVVINAYRQNPGTINPQLLMACTVGAIVIPSVSHDYKLPILAAPMAVLLLDIISRSEKEKDDFLRVKLFFLMFIVSIIYSTTLFSFTNKPGPFWGSNFPALVIMLLLTTFYSMLPKIELDAENDSV